MLRIRTVQPSFSTVPSPRFVCQDSALECVPLAANAPLYLYSTSLSLALSNAHEECTMRVPQSLDRLFEGNMKSHMIQGLRLDLEPFRSMMVI
jgi:hypothetical protein